MLTPEQRVYRRLELYDGPDRHGRYHYALFWLADYHPGHPAGEDRIAERGQHFFGVPPALPPSQTQDHRGGRYALRG